MEFPLYDDLPRQALLIVAGTAITLGLSGRIIRRLFPETVRESGNPDTPEAKRLLRNSMIVGKAENLLTLLFVISGEMTGIALLIAAKSLVRKEEIARDPGFFLGGTLVNLAWGMAMGLLVRLAAVGPY